MAVKLAATHPDGHKRVRVPADPNARNSRRRDEDSQRGCSHRLNAVQARETTVMLGGGCVGPAEQLPWGFLRARRIIMRITDDGPGIPAEVLAKSSTPSSPPSRRHRALATDRAPRKRRTVASCLSRAASEPRFTVLPQRRLRAPTRGVPVSPPLRSAPGRASVRMNPRFPRPHTLPKGGKEDEALARLWGTELALIPTGVVDLPGGETTSGSRSTETIGRMMRMPKAGARWAERARQRDPDLPVDKCRQADLRRRFRR